MSVVDNLRKHKFGGLELQDQMAPTDKHDQLLEFSKLKLEEISKTWKDCDQEDLELYYNKICGLIRKLEISIDETGERMLESERTLDEIKNWSVQQKEGLQMFRELRGQIKLTLDEGRRQEQDENAQRELDKQRAINKEITEARLAEQKELEAAQIRQQQREEEWLKRKLEMEKDARAGNGNSPASSTTQSVKLQRYTITPFQGDYKDWIRFWNQFEVEVDGAKISEISKFNYLLELVKGQPREDILGLPHTVEGYQEAKKILQITYGKDCKVHKALIKEMESLHSITDIRRLDRIHEFYNKLSRVVQTLSTMNKLQTPQSAVYTLMDKLGPVREVITQTDDKWEEWALEQLVEALRKFVDRNPLRAEEKSKQQGGSGDGRRNAEKLMMQGSQRYTNANRCVYCGSTNHSSVNCTRVLTVAARRDLIRRKNLCYNCLGDNHLVSACRSRPCKNCGQRHHTSLCERRISTVPEQGSVPTSTEKNLSASTWSTSTLHATVRAMVNGQEARIMIDTGAGSSYVCSDLITRLGISPIRQETRCIEQMYGTVTRVDIYSLTIESVVVDGFNFVVDCINAEKDVLTSLPNPRIKDLKRKYPRLHKLQLSDEDEMADQLPVHIIVGAADYQRIRSTEPPILGNNPDTDPGAEFTMLGWILYGRLISEGDGVEKEFLLNSSQSEFERLCSMDVLGLEDADTLNLSFNQDFEEQIKFKSEGFYETWLPWKLPHGLLPTNKGLAMARLWGTTRHLERHNRLVEYNAIMQEQTESGILEPAPPQPTGEIVHYVPHHPVIRESAESTKSTHSL